MPLIEISQPAAQPVTPAEVKAAARVDGTEFDGQLPLIIAAVTRQAEALTGRAFITRRMELVLDAFPRGEIDLLLPSVQSIVSVTYRDTAGVYQTLANTEYTLAPEVMPSLLHPAYGKSWPETRVEPNAVRVRFDVGYGDEAADVPEQLRLWIIAHCVQILQSPDGLAGTGGVATPLPLLSGLLDPFRVWRV